MKSERGKLPSGGSSPPLLSILTRARSGRCFPCETAEPAQELSEDQGRCSQNLATRQTRIAQAWMYRALCCLWHAHWGLKSQGLLNCVCDANCWLVFQWKANTFNLPQACTQHFQREAGSQPGSEPSHCWNLTAFSEFTPRLLHCIHAEPNPPLRFFWPISPTHLRATLRHVCRVLKTLRNSFSTCTGDIHCGETAW